VLRATIDGSKDILGVWIGENECSKIWFSVLNDLKNRGILDVYLFCVDGLKGFKEAISAAYPKAQIQTIHYSSNTFQHTICKLQRH